MFQVNAETVLQLLWYEISTITNPKYIQIYGNNTYMYIHTYIDTHVPEEAQNEPEGLE